MEIAIIINSPVLGGAERVAFNLAKWLNCQDSVKASIIALKKTALNSFDTSESDYVEINGKNKILALRKAVKNKRPDIVLTLSVPLCVYTIPALFGLRLTHVVSERNAPAQFSGKKITRLLSRLLMRNADAYVFQTKEAQAFYGGAISKRSVVIHNPISNILVPDRHEVNKEIVNVGRLDPQKNQMMLINAFSEIIKDYPDYSLIIWGEGRERMNLEKRIDNLQLSSKISLPGSTNNIFDKIKRSALFVMTSDYEGMPNALMEAMALGLPCISTDCPCGGPSELIHNGEDGVLIPVGDKDALINAIKKVLSDKEFANRIGKAAETIRDSHSMDRICAQWLGFFNKLMMES